MEKLVKESLEEFRSELNEYRMKGKVAKSTSQSGNIEYATPNLPDDQILSLAHAYLSNKINLKNIDNRIKVANDLGALTGKMQKDPSTSTGKLALLYKCVKSNLITVEEYKQLYFDLNELHKRVVKGIKNADPASRYFGRDRDPDQPGYYSILKGGE